MEVVCSAPLVHTSQMKEALNASSAHSKFHTPNREQSKNLSVSTYVSFNFFFERHHWLCLCLIERRFFQIHSYLPFPYISFPQPMYTEATNKHVK